MRTIPVAAVAMCACLAAGASQAQAPQGLSRADMAAIAEVTNTWGKAALAKDWATVASLYTEDGVLNPPNEPAVKGRAAIKAWMEKFPPMTALKLNQVKVDGRGDLAYVLGSYTMTIAPPGAAPGKDSGKYVEVRRKQPDGKWLVAVDIFNSDLAATPAPK